MKSLLHLAAKHDLIEALPLPRAAFEPAPGPPTKAEHREHPATQRHRGKALSIGTEVVSASADFPTSNEGCSSARGTNTP